jgi:pimeloyl-ACP methyl ester carboxylesterase
MKSTRLITVIAALLIAGCGSNQYALQIAQLETARGKIDEDLKGTAEQLIQRKTIDNHEVCPMADGVEIDVWEIDARTSDGSGKLEKPLGTVVILHQAGSSKASYPFMGTGERLAKMGYDVVLPDLRAHGRSTGKYTTYGVKESDDVKAVVDSLLAAGTVHEPVYTMGMGLGAATAIQYAAKDPRCKGVVAMTPFKDLRSYVRPQLLLLSQQDFDKAIERAGEIADFDPAATSVVVAAGKTNAALFLCHGMLDMSVPAEDVKEIYAAAPGPKKLVLVTPGPEELAMWSILEDWIADKVNTVASGGLEAKPAQ